MEKDSKRRRKFHEALMKVYFPPPPVRSDQMNDTEDNEVTEDVQERLDATFSLDHAETACYSSDGIDDGAPEKPTRAQRKRIRKRKLKEAASSRRKIIGPLLPSEYELPGMKKPQTNDVDVDAPETNVGSQDTSCKT